MKTVNINIPSLTIVVPCLNEEKNVRHAAEAIIRALDHYKIDGELIIISDGSTDRTWEIIQEVQRIDSRVRVMEHEKPWGIGSSFWHGVLESKKEYVTIIPGDNENDPCEVLRNFYLAGSVDVIVPFIHNVEVRSKVRRFISSIYRFIINMSFGCNLNYTNGAVIYNRDVLLDFELKSTGFFYQAELLIRLIRAGYLYAEVPQMLAGRNSGKSKAVSFKSLGNVVTGYLNLAWDVHVKRIAGRTDHKLNPKSASYRRM